MQFGFKNTFLSDFGFSKPSSAPVPPPQYGILGIDSNLPIDNFLVAGGNVVSMYAESLHDAEITLQKIRARSDTQPNNRMRVGIYEKTGPDSGNNLIISPDIIDFGTSDSILSFAQSKTINQGSEYWLVAQAEDGWYFYYDSSPTNNYGFIGSFPFGSIPPSFSGVSTFGVILQSWCEYTY